MKIKNSNIKNILGRLLPATAMFIALVLCFNLFSPTFFVRGSESEALTSTDEVAEEIDASEIVGCIKSSLIYLSEPGEEYIRKYEHGSIIERTFELHTISELGEICDVYISLECDGIKILNTDKTRADFVKYSGGYNTFSFTLRFQVENDFHYGHIGFAIDYPEADREYFSKFDINIDAKPKEEIIYFCHEEGYDYVTRLGLETFRPYCSEIDEYYREIERNSFSYRSDVDSPSGEPA